MLPGLAVLQKTLPDTVHKEHEDDVLVCNERGPLPASIDASLLSDSRLDEVGRSILKSFYRASGDPAGRLVLRSLPVRIDPARLQDLAPAEQELVQRHYSGAPQLVLHSPFVDEVDEVVLMQALTPRADHIADSERAAIDRVFVRLPEVERPRVRYLNLLIDTNHYFFFRRHQEHVPGLMMIEAARQAMYAHYHCHSPWTRAQMAFTIESLEIDFQGFTNPNYPVRIRVDEEGPAGERDTGEQQRRACFFQMNRQTAEARVRAKVIKTGLFKRLRNIRPQSDCERFLPVKNIARTVSFCNGAGQRIEGALRNVSMEGLGAEFGAGTADLSIGSRFEGLLHVEGLGYIGADFALRWTRPEGDRMAAGFEILHCDTANERRMREAIKNYCFLDTARTVR